MAGDSPLQGRWEYRSFVEAWCYGAGSPDSVCDRPLFDRFGWLELLHRFCFSDRNADIVRAAESDAQAWLFLTETGARRRSALANWYSFAFRPVFDNASDPAIKARLLAAMTHSVAKRVAHIDLYPITDDDGTLALMMTALRDSGWTTVSRQMGINHFLDLNGRDFDAYWATRPGPLRTLVQRKGRGAPFDFTIHHDVTDSLWADYLTVYGKSWKPSEPHFPFLRALAQQQADAGTLRLGFARMDGVPVAAQLWTVQNNVALIHKLAHDIAYDAQSPGTLLSHHMFRAAIEEDLVMQIDYGTGNNRYKMDWMEAQRPLYRIDAYNLHFPVAWLPALRARISSLVAGRLTR